MVQIKCLSNGIYSLKNSHIPFGQGFQPPPLTDKDRLNRAFLVQVLPLSPTPAYKLFTFTASKCAKLKRACSFSCPVTRASNGIGGWRQI